MPNIYSRSRYVIAATVFFIIAGSFVAYLLLDRNAQKKAIRFQTELTTQQVSIHLHDYFVAVVQSTRSLRRDIKHRYLNTPEEFNRRARYAYESFESTLAIAWVDTNGIILALAPPDGFEKVPGRHIGQYPHVIEPFNAAVNTGKPQTTRPFNLFPGKPGFVMIKPMRSRGNTRDGYLGIVCEIDSTIKRYFQTDITRNFNYLITDNRDNTVIHEHNGDTIDPSSSYLAKTQLEVCGDSWNVTLHPNDKFIKANISNLGTWLMIPGLLLAAFASLLTFKLQTRRQQLTHSERKFRSTFDAAPTGIGLVSLDGALIEVNESFAGTLGYARKELGGVKLSAILDSKDRLVIHDRMQGMIRKPHSSQNFEAAFVHKSGRIIHADVALTLLCETTEQPIHFIIQTNDVTESKAAVNALQTIADGVSANVGKSFFQTLTRHLATSLNLDYASIGELDPDNQSQVRTIAVYAKGAFADNFEYSLVDTPCENVVHNSICSYPTGVCEKFPKDQLLIDMGIDGYVGACIHDSKGNPSGIIAVLHGSRIHNASRAEHMLKIVAARAGAELERMQNEAQLKYQLQLEDLVSTISTRFVNVNEEEIDTAIGNALKKIANFLDVDRTCIFLFAPDNITATRTHEWCSEHVKSQKHQQYNLTIAKFPLGLADILEGKVLNIPRVDDIPDEFINEREEIQATGIQSLLGVPMTLQNRVIGFLGLDAIRFEKHFSEHTISVLQLIAEIFANAIDRQRADNRQKLMMSELDHRVKNNLAAVASLAERTLMDKPHIDQFADRFLGRLRAMAWAHEALAKTRWDGVSFEQIVKRVVRPHSMGESTTVLTDGPSITLPASSALPVALTLHELGTNALKYGALACEHGAIQISWLPCAENKLQIDWVETGADPAAKPIREGAGMGLIRGLIGFELKGNVEFDFTDDGLHCIIQIPLSAHLKPIINNALPAQIRVQ